MEEAETMAWNAQRGYWLDKQEVAKKERGYWDLKLEMLKTERHHITTILEGWG